TTAAKPVRRSVYVAGRWLGVVVVAAALLAASMAAIYGLAHYLRQRPTDMERRLAAGERPEREGDYDRAAVDNEIFAARVERSPDPLPAEEFAARWMEELFAHQDKEKLIREYIRAQLGARARRKGEAPPSPEKVERFATNPRTRQRALDDMRREVAKDYAKRALVVPPGGTFFMTFSDIHAPADRLLQLRYKLQASKAQKLPKAGILKSAWAFHKRLRDKRVLLGTDVRDDTPDTATTLELSPRFLTDDHKLLVAYGNRPENATEVVLSLDDIALRYQVGGFAGNVARAGGVILIRLMFLAAAGVFCGTFLSFPVACMVCLVMFLAGLMGDFALEATKLGHFTGRDLLDYASYGLTRGIFFFLPKLPIVESPGGSLRDGLLIGWTDLAREALTGTGLRAVIALAFGSLIFWRRELARVQV
ncbi:MAG: hypothetical protein ACYS5V_07770, partial [Planctomycetota bacterium]